MNTRVAVLGMGRWGTTWCRVLAAESGVCVTTVAAGRNVDRLRTESAFAVYDHYSAALAQQDLDAAIVALPATDHSSAVHEAIDLGVAVLCEKPLVTHSDELERLAKAAEVSASPVRVNQNYRLRDWVARVLERLPDIGQLHSVEIDFAQPEFMGGGRERLRHPLLADMSIHHLDLLRALSGQEATVLDARSARQPDSVYRGDTDVAATLVLHSGGEVHYRGTWAARGATTPWDGNWVLRGSRGTIRVSDLTVTVEAPGGTHVFTTQPPIGDADLSRAWRQFASALDGDESAGCSVDDNARSLQLVFDLSAKAGVEDPHELCTPEG